MENIALFSMKKKCCKALSEDYEKLLKDKDQLIKMQRMVIRRFEKKMQLKMLFEYSLN